MLSTTPEHPFSGVRISAMFVITLALFICSITIPNSLSAQDRCDQALDLGNGDCQSFYNGFGTPDPGTGQFCESYENNLWYTFVAQDRMTTVYLLPSFCAFGRGMEMEIFQANFCTIFNTPIFCSQTMGVLPMSATFATNIGETYYIITDGIRGDVCDYDLRIEHGTCPTNPMACDTLPTPIITGEDSICFGQGVHIYEIENYDPGFGTYTWSIPDLPNFTDLGNGRIEIDWSEWTGTGSPMVCVAQVDGRCRFSKACFTVFNQTIGVPIDPQSIRRCPHSFPLTLSDYFHTLFINQLVPVPPGLRVSFYLTRDDVINDVNEVTQILTPGDYDVYIALTIGDCFRVPLPDDPAHIETEFLDLDIQVETFCEGQVFRIPADVTVTELNGYPGWPFDSLAFFRTAANAANNQNRMTLPASINDDGRYWYRFNTTNGCNDTASFEIEFVELPVFTAEWPDTFCSVLGDAVYDLNTTPYTFTTGDINDVYFTYFSREINAINNQNPIGPVVSLTGTYYAVATNSFGCRSAPVPIDVVFMSTPYVDIFGNGDLCAGDTAEIIITTINAPTPFNLILEDDFGNEYDIYSVDASLFYYIPIFESTEIRIKDFITNPATFCPYDFNEDVAFEVIVLPQAELDIVTGCGDESGVIFRASQGGIYTVHLRNQNTGETYVFTGELDDEFLSIPLSNGDRIVLDSFQYDNECWSFESFTSDAAVLQDPLEVNNISIGACNNLMSTISFEISGGEPGTYEVLGAMGAIDNGGVFTSNPLSSGNYQIIVFDGRLCDTIDLNIMIDCGCITEAGQIQIADSDICEDELSSVFISDTTLAPGDIIQFILHEEPLPLVGTILGTNRDGLFPFDPLTMTYGQTYYITAWVGLELNGNVDTTGTCSVPTNTVEVRWLDIPTASFFDSLFVCETPLDTFVRINFTGTGPYTFSYRFGGQTTGPIMTNDPFIEVPLNGITQSGLFELVNFGNEACLGTFTGDGQIVVADQPTFINLIYTCAPQKDSFYFEVELIGGEPPFHLFGIDGASAGNIFTSYSLPSGFSGVLSMTDARNCSEIELNINRDCECESMTGTIPNDELFLCADSVVNLPFVLNPFVATGDGQGFLIKDNSNLDATGVLDIITTARIVFDDTYMVFGQTYYLMPVTSTLDINGALDLSHKCFMPSIAVPFTFFDTPEIRLNIASDTLNCVVKEMTLDAASSYVPTGFNFEWTVVSGNIVSGSQTLSPVIDQAGRYILRIYHSQASCEDEIVIDIFEDTELAVADIQGDTLLNCDNSRLLLDATGSSSGSQFDFIWSTINGNFLSFPGDRQAEVDQAGTYQLIVENQNTLCRDTALFVVYEDLNTPNAEVEPYIGTLDCNISTIGLTADTSGIQEDEVVSWASDNNFNLIAFHQIELNTPGIYLLIVENTISGCADTAFVSIDENVEEPELASVDSSFIDCTNTEVTLSVSVIGGAGGPYSYSWYSDDAAILSDTFLSDILVDESGTFFVSVTDQSNGCSSQNSLNVFDLQAPVDGTNLSIFNSPCGQTNVGGIQLSMLIGGTEPYLITLDGEVYTELPLQLNNLPDGSHNLSVEDLNGCLFDTTFVTRALNNVAVDLGTRQTVDEGLDFVLVPILSGSIDSFMWFIGDSALVDNLNTNLRLVPEDNVTITLQVFSDDGCFDMDSMQLLVNKYYNIFVPNAFSPNDDGINDRLMVFGPEKLATIESFQIYNRWGACVFERFDVLPNQEEFGWDGDVDGKPAATGVYAYQISATFNDGTTKFISGDFILLK